MPPPLTQVVQKKALRDAAIARRNTLSEERRSEFDGSIAAHLDGLLNRLNPGTVGFYWPHRGEVDLRPWVAAWLAGSSARRAALPVLQGTARPMIFRRWRSDCAMVKDRFGIPHPADGEELLPDAVLVPLVAFDARGYRIGYGGGYFDRTLAVLDPCPVAIGIGYECLRVASALPEPHDLPMDWLVTEAAATARG